MGTFPGRNTQGFAALLDRMLLREAGGPCVKEVAWAIDVAPSTLYDYCSGRLTFPPDLIGPLYEATRDSRILDQVLGPCGVAWHELPRCPGDAAEVLEQAVRAQREAVDVLEAVHGAAADGVVTRAELEAVRKEVAEAHRALARLLACVTAAAEMGPKG